MYRVDNPTGTQTLPPPTAPTATPDRYYSAGSESTGAPATIVEAEHLNMIQEELINAVVAGGQTPNKSLRDQLARAITAQIEALATNVAVGRNIILNGGQYVYQRGMGPWTQNQAMTTDRWRMQFTSGTMNVRRHHWVDQGWNPAPGTTAGPPGGPLVVTWTGAATANTYTRLQTVVNAWIAQRSKIMVSFFAQATSGTVRVGVNQVVAWGTRTDTIPGQSVLVTTTGQRHFVVLDGTAMPLSPPDRTQSWTAFNIWFSAATQLASQSGSVPVQSGTVIIGAFQAEHMLIESVTGGANFEITTPTPWSANNPDEESACLSYYQDIALFAGRNGNVPNQMGFTVSLLAKMLGWPTVTMINGITGISVWPNSETSLGVFIEADGVYLPNNAYALVSAEPTV